MRSIWKFVSATGFFSCRSGNGKHGLIISSLFAENPAEVSLSPIIMKRGHMHEEIGTAAGAIWKALHTNGELTLSQLKKHTKDKAPVFDWAIGWLARENKIALKQEKRTILVRLV